VKVKAEAEESIRTCMLYISDRMPDFKVYERIYPDPELGRMLAEAYRGVILFAKEVTVYFQARGIGSYPIAPQAKMNTLS
jgi:AAA+ ATPase superfamily predicted ATPase